MRISRRRIAGAFASAALAAAALSACYPQPTWGPGSPNYACHDAHATIWLSERPVHVRFAEYTIGVNLCTMYGTDIYSAVPYDNFGKEGFYAGLMNAGVDYLRTDVSTSGTVTIEGGVHAQQCASSSWVPVLCSFMDHVHLFYSLTTPPHSGPSGAYWTTDRGDISVWSTP